MRNRLPALKSATLVAALGLLLGSSEVRAVPPPPPTYTMTDLGVYTGDTASSALAISADGTKIYGYSLLSGTTYYGAEFFAGTTTPNIYTGSPDSSKITGTFASGTILVGYTVMEGDSIPFLSLAGLAGIFGSPLSVEGSTSTIPYAVAGGMGMNVATVVGQGYFSGAYRAFVTDFGMGTTTTLIPFTGGDNYSAAYALSDAGAFIVGEYGTANFNFQAFKYEREAPSATGLGWLGTGEGSSARGISGNGAIVVGWSYTAILSTKHAFSYDTSMHDLGVLEVGKESWANAISNDGTTIVGGATITGGTRAFKYVSGTMSDLGTLGGDFSEAHAVNSDGTIIVGESNLEVGGPNHAFIYAASAGTILDVQSWNQSVAYSSQVLRKTVSLTTIVAESAHHRTLVGYGNLGKKNQVWVTGDFGNNSRSVDRNISAGEVGTSTTFGDNLVAGLSLGYSAQNEDTFLGGYSHIAGQHAVLEADYVLGGNKGVVSLTAIYGDWKARSLRGYTTGLGTDYSAGETDVTAFQARLRYDGPVWKPGTSGFNLTPYVSFSWGHHVADAYTETGGSYDAQFDKQTHNSYETRLGAESKYALNDKVDLILSAEWIHRFDGHSPTLTGTEVDNGLLPFSIPGERIHANQARVGLDLDYRFAANTQVTFTVHATSVGEGHDVSGAISFRRGF